MPLRVLRHFFVVYHEIALRYCLVLKRYRIYFYVCFPGNAPRDVSAAFQQAEQVILVDTHYYLVPFPALPWADRLSLIF